MAAIIQIDQVGLATGTPGKSRSDGLSTGATVTVTSTGAGSNHALEFEWVPEDDTTTLTSFTPTSSTTWDFSPTANIPGTWRLKLTVDGEVSRRLFSVRTTHANLRIPSLNESASPLATLLTGSTLVDESEFNENFSLGPFTAGNYGGAYPDMVELFKAVEALSVPPGQVPANTYISLAGDDGNDGLTTATPVATWTRLWALYPQNWGDNRTTIHVGDGLHTSFVRPPGFYQGRNSWMKFIGDGAGQGTDDGKQEITTDTVGTYTVTSSVGFITVTGPLGDDTLSGYSIEMTSGPAIGQRRMIRWNDDTTIEVNDAFTVAPDPSDTFQIFRPSATLQNADHVFFRDARVMFVNLAFDSLVSGKYWEFERCEVVCYGTRWASPSFFAAMRPVWSKISLGRIDVLETGDTASFAGEPGTNHWRGWGASSMEANIPLTNPIVNSPSHSLVVGYPVVGNLNGNNTQWDIYGGRINFSFSDLSGGIFRSFRLQHYGGFNLRRSDVIFSGTCKVQTNKSGFGFGVAVFSIRYNSHVAQSANRFEGTHSNVPLIRLSHSRWQIGDRTSGGAFGALVMDGSAGSGQGIVLVNGSVLTAQENNAASEVSVQTGTQPALVLDGASMFVVNGIGISFSFTSANSHGLRVANGSRFVQIGGATGALTFTSTSGGNGVLIERGSYATFRGATITAGAGQVGLRVTTGSQAWFVDGTAVSATGGAGDIQIGSLTAQASTVLASSGDFIVDSTSVVPAGHGSSGATIIGRD